MGKAPDSRTAGKTILIVDDEFGVLEVLEFFLSDLGFNVTSALNGRDALARLRESKPDLIILDFMMPVLDGAGVLDALAGSEDTNAIPVILTSALPEATIKQRCSGYDMFLRKPYRTENLVQAIEKILNRTTPDESMEC
jgi:CheY-like chemotaxis protein